MVCAARSTEGLERGPPAHGGRDTVDPSRNVPLTARAIELLDQMLASMPTGQPYIVGIKNSLRDALWRRTRNQAGVEDLHFHNAKHEAATRLAQHIDMLALSHAIGTKAVKLLRDTYYNNDASWSAALLPAQLSTKPAQVIEPVPRASL
jgi:integrase